MGFKNNKLNTMKTAEEILLSNSIGKDVFVGTHNVRLISFDDAIKAINQAREEVIRECAEIAQTTNKCSVWNCEGESVNKSSILNLIKEIQ